MEMINPDASAGCLLPRKAELGSGFFFFFCLQTSWVCPDCKEIELQNTVK